MNPKLKHFIEDNEDITLIGIAWSCFWRLYMIFIGVGIALAVLSAFVSSN